MTRTYPGYHAVRRCEAYLLGALGWDLHSVTPLHFIENFTFQGATLFSNDHLKTDQDSALVKVRRHVDYFALLALRQDFMLTRKFSDETIAVAIIYAARKASRALKNSWNQEAFSVLFPSLDS